MRSLAAVTLFLLPLLGACAVGPADMRYGPEVQAYPTGIIPGIQVQYPIFPREVVFTRFAANLTDRQGYGEHDNEEGDGAGFGVGWRKYQHNDKSGWLWGLRADLWSLNIDWRQDSGPGAPRSGSTDVLVLQPTIEGGYSWLLGDGTWSFDLSSGLGAEINLDEDGEAVGDGVIFLLGFSFLYNG